MSSKKRNRYTVPTDYGRAELFSTLQTNKGDVQLFLRPALNLETGGINNAIAHEKYSLHRSAGSAGTTITHTIDSENGFNIFKNATFVKDSSQVFCWNVRTCACPDLRNERYKLIERSKDTIISISDSLSSDDHVFCYFIFAQRINENFPEVKGFNLTIEVFDYFTIGIYTSYLDIPNSGIGSFFHKSTSFPSIFGSTIRDETVLSRGGAASDDANDIPQNLIKDYQNLELIHNVRFTTRFPEHLKTEHLKSRSSFIIRSGPNNTDEVSIPNLTNASGMMLVV